MADAHDLGSFEGAPVLGTSIAIHKAGDGLSKSLNVEPIKLKSRTRVQVVLECEVGPVGFAPIKETKGFTRTHVLNTITATLVDEALVRELLDEQQRKIDESQGKVQLPFGQTEDDSVAFDRVAMNPEKAKVEQLREWLRDHDLPSTGKKPELVERVNRWWLDRKTENEQTTNGGD